MHTLSEISRLAALAEIRATSPGPAQPAWTHIVEATVTIQQRILAPAWILELALGELAAAVEELEALAPIDTHLH